MSVLVDTSIWVDHLRSGNEGLSDLLRALPRAKVASEAELDHLIRSRSLHGRGIGYVAAQLLASTLLVAGTTLWSADRGLRSAAAELGSAHPG